MSQPLSHIMCVDDENDILEIVKLCLEDLGGIKATCQNDISAALKDVGVVRPDLLLLDVMMPGINGVNAIRLLRQQPGCARLPIILMTARVQPNEVRDYLDNGASGVIAKPFDPVTLVDQIRKIWDGLDR